MRVVGLPRAFYCLSRHMPIVLSPKAQGRLRWLRCFEALRKQGLSSTQASQTIFIPRSTIYRWQKRLKEEGQIDFAQPVVDEDVHPALGIVRHQSCAKE